MLWWPAAPSSSHSRGALNVFEVANAGPGDTAWELLEVLTHPPDGPLGPEQDHAERHEALGAQVLHHLGDDVALGAAGARHQDDAVRRAGDLQSVRRPGRRRRIEDDDRAALAEPRDRLLEARRGKQLRRTRRRLPGWQHPEAFADRPEQHPGGLLGAGGLDD